MLAAATLVVACGGEPPGAESPAGPPAREATAALASLRALGYAGWSEPEGAPELLSGARVLLPERVQPGLVLYADDRSLVRLLDLAGLPVRTWRVPRGRCEVATLFPDGRLAALSVDLGVCFFAPDGTPAGGVDLAAHHELAPLADGGLVVPVWELVSYRGRRVRFDRLVWLAPDGAELASWSTRTHHEALRRLHPPLALDTAPPPGAGEEGTVYDYYHLNSVQELPPTALGARDARFRAGNLLVGSRNASLVFVLDPRSGEVVWSWGPGVLDFPHTPRMTPAGTILVFDNGWHRGWSRVLEIDPPSGQVVWSWQADPRADFFTRDRGACQRLANGNTQICDSARGRVFEVTPEGELAWEFRNPERREGRRRRIYRMERVPLERGRLAALAEER
jgi:hypothetical protein